MKLSSALFLSNQVHVRLFKTFFGKVFYEKIIFVIVHADQKRLEKNTKKSKVNWSTRFEETRSETHDGFISTKNVKRE